MDHGGLQTAVRRELALDAPRPPRRSPLLRLSVAAALLYTIGAGPLAAQAPYRQELLRGFSCFDVGSNSSPTLADLDGDGDLDAVVGDERGGFRYFANTGSSTAPSFVERTASSNPFNGFSTTYDSSVALIDLDGDADLDAVVGGAITGLQYLANTGTSSAPAFVQRTGSANPFDGLAMGPGLAPELVDLDDDGDLDAVVGDPMANLRYFQNTGTSTAPAFIERTGTANPLAGALVTYINRPALADLDGDGDLDAVVGEYSGHLQYFQNSGSASAPAFIERTGSANPLDGFDIGNASRPEVADLDGDGDFDAVLGESRGTLWYFENTGNTISPAFIRQSGTTSAFGGIDAGQDSLPELADLDGDGDLDAIVGYGVTGVQTYENLGPPASPIFDQQTGAANPFDGLFTTSGSNQPELVDLDRDGDLDAVVGNFQGTLFYLENTGSPTSAAFVERTGSANPFDGVDVNFRSSPVLADLDGDGDWDAVVGNDLGELHYFENTGSSTAPAFVERTGTANPFADVLTFGVASPSLADLDRDGDLDLLVGEFPGDLLFYANTGSASAPAFVARTGSANPFQGVGLGGLSSPDLADLDGDGDFDVLSGESGGRVVFLRSLAVVFGDGFETGTTSAWTVTVP